MDYQENRQKFIHNYFELCEKLELTMDLMNGLFEAFPITMKTCLPLLNENKMPKRNDKNKPNAEALVKSVILLELTKKRYSCQRLIEVLRQWSVDNDSDDSAVKAKKRSLRELASSLEVFNQSPGRKKYGDEIDIRVEKVVDHQIITGRTQAYEMSRNPRGLALIIDNVKDIVSCESSRFAHIFKELLFDVQVIEYDLTSKQILQRMVKLRDQINDNYKETKIVPQAMIVMVISHGTDERIKGKFACLSKSDPAYDENDQIEFKEIMDVFAPRQLPDGRPSFQFNHADFLKIFFFTCCRRVNDKARYPRVNLCAEAEDLDTNANAIRINSCAEGYLTGVEIDRKYTIFGRCLSETLAQFACREDLVHILNRTSARLRDGTGYFSPEMTIKALKNRVYFNPGHPN